MSSYIVHQIKENRAEERMINGVNNIFRLGKDTVIKGMINLFRLEKDTVLEGKKSFFYKEKTKTLRDKDIKNELFESEEDYYKPLRTDNTFSRNYIEYESNGDKDKTLLSEDYLDKIEPYLNDLTDNHKIKDEWIIPSIIAINFISSKKDSDETPTKSKIHTKSDNIEIMMGSETDEIIENLFESILQKYQKRLEKSTKQ